MAGTRPKSTMRLARYIAQAGIAARRKAEDLIRAGQVRVNGEKVTDVATNVHANRDEVTVNGEAVVPQAYFYVLLNKPKGCITAVSDPWDRPTVMDYLPRTPVAVRPVGRLDFYSEGVLFLTNDGELASALLGPRSRIEKTYHVKLRGHVTEDQLDKLRVGVPIGPRRVTKPAQVDRLTAPSKHDWLVITLTEGKSRQIHRMIEGLGLSVTKLQRVAFAGLTFHGLRVGDARELSQAEVTSLRRIAGLPDDERATARGKWRVKREDTELGRRAKARARAEGPNPDARPPERARAKAKAAGRAKPAQARGERREKRDPRAKSKRRG